MNDIVETLVALVSAVGSIALPILVSAVLSRFKVATNADLSAKVIAATEAAAGAAYRYAASREGGLGNVAVQSTALTVGLNYVRNKMPETLATLGLNDAHVQSMVAARLGVLMAGDPTITAGQPAVTPPAGPVLGVVPTVNPAVAT